MGAIYQKKVQMNPKRIMWKDEDCERMVRNEFMAMRSLLGAISFLSAAKRELPKRLESIPSGKQRMALAYGAVQALADDLIGTMTVQQAKQLQNTMSDMEIQMVPKRTPNSRNAVVPIDTMTELVWAAREKCHMCTAMDQDIRECNLYKILEAVSPLEDYGDGLVCPYYDEKNW